MIVNMDETQQRQGKRCDCTGRGTAARNSLASGLPFYVVLERAMGSRCSGGVEQTAVFRTARLSGEGGVSGLTFNFLMLWPSLYSSSRLQRRTSQYQRYVDSLCRYWGLTCFVLGVCSTRCALPYTKIMSMQFRTVQSQKCIMFEATLMRIFPPRRYWTANWTVSRCIHQLWTQSWIGDLHPLFILWFFSKNHVL